MHAENFKKLSFMKKYLLTLFSVIVSITLMGQTTFTVTADSLTYTILEDNNVSVKRQDNMDIKRNLVIPSQVEYDGTTYTVTQIANSGFYQNNSLPSVVIPNSVTSIGKNAFQNCGNLTEVGMGENITTIDAYAFQGCHKLHSILLPQGLTRIENNTFENCHGLNEIIIPASVNYIGEFAFHNTHSIEVIFMGSGNIEIESTAFLNCNNVHVACMNIGVLTFNGEYLNIFGHNAIIHAPCGTATSYPTSGDGAWSAVNPDGGCISTTRKSGYFCLPETWVGYDYWITSEGVDYPANGTYEEKEAWLKKFNNEPNDDRYPNFVPRKPNHPFHIASGDTVILQHSRHIYPYNSINEGVLRLEGNGQLIERDTVYNDAWGEHSGITGESNLGFVYMHENLGGVIEIVVPATQGKWNFVGAPFKDYDLYAVKVGAGNRDVTIVEFDYANKQWSNIFSTVEDEIKAGEGFLAWPFYDGGIVFSTKRDMTEISNTKQTKILESDFALNNDDVVVEETVEGTDENGRWLALANPYPAKLCVNSFVSGNSSANIQGQGIYVHDAQTNSFTFKGNGGNYDLGVGQGFFVNFNSAGDKEIAFTKNQLHDYNEPNHTPASKSSKKQFMTLSMLASGVESELLFAHNEKAQQGYDIFDANKLFAIEEITEPYFVTDGIALVKEEVKDLPYYAKMNVRSFEDKEVVFRINDIPEDLVVFLIDNGKDIRMNGKTEYTTTITAGENADRFQLLVKKASSIEDVKDDNIEISNSNRFVSVSSTQTDLIIEVYNALGQKIMTTNNYNFNLNESSAGAYIVKAYNKAVSKTQKIVIK